jgi:hypothetical protein
MLLGVNVRERKFSDPRTFDGTVVSSIKIIFEERES